jgi:hypothetical protein
MIFGTQVSESTVAKIFGDIFAHGEVAVFESNPKRSREVQEFSSADDCLKYIKTQSAEGSSYIAFAVHFADTSGFVEAERRTLDPEKCDGHNFLYQINGWGLIKIKIMLSPAKDLYCDISVNSEKRANKWYVTYPEFKSPALWNWKQVEKHARRLKRYLKTG